MQIVIDIPEDLYKKIINDAYIGIYDGMLIAERLQSGTPLPKGHGRLKDEYELLVILNERYLNFSTRRDLDMFADIVEDAKTIIEADKEQIDE